jgi:hypothetical protein
MNNEDLVLTPFIGFDESERMWAMLKVFMALEE